MYLKHPFKITVWCEIWTTVLAIVGLGVTLCRHDYLPLFRSRQELHALDMTLGMVPRVAGKEFSLQYWYIFPVLFSRFCISQGFASHRVVCITFSNPARANAHSPKTRSRTGPMIHELVKTKTEISLTPHPNKTNFFVVVRTAHISSLVEQSKITACNHAQLTRLFTKHWAYKMNNK